MLLKTYQYNIDLEHLPGKDMHTANLVSRQCLPDNEGSQMFESINMVSLLPTRPECLERIKKVTVNDEVMNLL